MFRNQSGFSLAEILVATGLLGVLSLGVVKMSGMLNKNMKTAEVKYDKLEISQDISRILADPTTCTTTFSAVDASSGSVVEIKETDGTVKFALNSAIGSQSVEIISFKLDDSFPDVSFPKPGKGDTYLIVEFKKKKNTQSSKNARIKLKVEVDGAGKILSCHSLNGGSSLWDRTPSDPDSIFFNGNKVGINTSDPVTVLDVNGAIRLGDSALSCDTTIEGSLKYSKIAKALFLCSELIWRKVVLEEPYVWVNASAPTDGHTSTCTKQAYTAATDQGYGICASGESQPLAGGDAKKISYKYGTWGGAGNGGTLHIGSGCYRVGQKQDHDATDQLVAWLCKRY